MIKVTNLSYGFPQKDLYDKISFSLENGDHCAFIGTSGTGKSTLADILMNPEEYLYDGKIEIEPNCKIGYVSQFAQIDEDEKEDVTVFNYLSETFVKLQDKITEICEVMGTASDLDALMEKYQQVLETFEAMDGDNYETNIMKKLSVANLEKHADLPIAKLSGGEFKLLQVIREMLSAPNVLIMDEPDVFLDFDHLNSLRNLIKSHKGILLVITHNRYLLNHCFNKIIHLENKELQEFTGSYIEYNFMLLQNKIELQEQSVADTLEIQRNQDIVNRMRKDATIHTSAAKGRSLHARVSLLERLEARRVKEPFVDIKQPEIKLVNQNEIEEITAIKVSDYSIGFVHPLLENVSFEIKSTDKVALIGANGTGKTTLLKAIYDHTDDAIEIGGGVEMAFLSQNQSQMLNESNTVLNEFLDAGFEDRDSVLAHLTAYGLEEEHLTQKISSLSGGEKNLLQLAKVSISNANLLLLDEPTSHLDTYAQAALEQAMTDYNGAILMISHDFYSIANCMDYVLFIENKGIRRMSIRKFRKMIYDKHFEKDYLLLEQEKKEVELKITAALKKTDFEQAKVLTEQLETIIQKL